MNIDLSKITNTPFGLFNIALALVDNKLMFLLVIILSESTSLITTWAIVTKHYWLIITSPILAGIISLFVQNYNIKLHNVIRHKWKQIVFTHFNSMSFTSRRKIEIKDFTNQVNRTANTLIDIITWMFPTIIRLIFILTNCLIAFYVSGNTFYIIMLPILFSLYYWFRMSIKQKTLTELRKTKKDIEKVIRPLFSWNLHLFQYRNRTVHEILKIEEPIIQADMMHLLGWCAISRELGFFTELISGISLYCISSNFSDILVNKVIFNQFTNSISNIGNLTNSITKNMKDFDSFIDIINSSDSSPIQEQYNIEFSLSINSFITLSQGTKEFKLHASHLTIDCHDKILLRGESGIGKTQLVNSLQGLIPGTLFNSKYEPKQYESKWQYMNQQTRETIPSYGLTIRQMLEDEPDNYKIMYLVNIVLLDDKFNIDNLDEAMDSLSGGERMRLSILYTLWDLEKRNKQILILDEPEQGLDEDIRVKIMNNILVNIKKPILVIYHGSKLDLLQLSFTKVWNFIKDETKTNVFERKFIDFKREILKEIKMIIQE
jgi:ABC-type multidrug transport system fused ATPase/permease subunit